MNGFDATRRRLLQAGGLLMVSVALPVSLRASASDAARPTADATVATGPAPDRVDSFIAISADGAVTAFNGHVDLGTGVRTALAQIVADELCVPIGRVTMVLGDTARTPDQGPTIASATIQVTSVPLRRAAAQVRMLLAQRAARRFAVSADAIRLVDGGAYPRGRAAQRVGYGELVRGADLHVPLAHDDAAVDAAATDAPARRRYVGASVPRVDIPAKATGAPTYVHDVRVPGMLHGRVIRPPYPGADSSAPLGRSLVSVDRASVAHLPGLVAVVVIRDFVGVVAQREEQAIAAMRALKVQWREWHALPDLAPDRLRDVLAAHPSKPRPLCDSAGFEQALAGGAQRIDADYVWPFQMHASIGPSCAVADVAAGRVEVWSGTQNPHELRKDLARLLERPAAQVNVIRMEASGCYGRNCADDVSADAALLSRAVGRPVRVQLMREQEAGWEPKGTAQLIRVRGALDASHGVAAYELRTCYPSNGATTLPLVLTGVAPNEPVVAQMGDRTAIPQYAYPAMRVTAEDAAPLVRASWLRGVSALPNVFAHECWIDEAAYRAGVDPIAYRLRYLKDPRAIALLAALKARAGWVDGSAHRVAAPSGQRVASGRGVAYARYFHSKFPGFGAAWAAWVCDVDVDRSTGLIRVKKVTVAHDCGQMINPDGVRHQVHGNVIQSVSRVLKEAVSFDGAGTTSLEWGAYPILRFDELPEIDALLLDHPNAPPMGAGESASVPSAAAIANAVFDATGVRLREVPFTPARVLRALREAHAGAPAA
ncbi:xanthine dehydrogenase family protein molybdopterin-binding subunit [Burkholderia ubonensis]|uniref:Aldehyde dehydrogenase n=1 Tax=Burkholderia ubonensis subsp. mesacidophila TaxID=265293 RepID=A0A2A4FNV8_9BURK|nr:molybdopterin cofactor-binding domain-containing protein [Burkholderia ubonensis]PCE34362.1 aldehyde dehydrogenase [Burkholderia ubonensis subsp. mesacidophila]